MDIPVRYCRCRFAMDLYTLHTAMQHWNGRKPNIYRIYSPVLLKVLTYCNLLQYVLQSTLSDEYIIAPDTAKPMKYIFSEPDKFLALMSINVHHFAALSPKLYFFFCNSTSLQHSTVCYSAAKQNFTPY